MNDHVSVGIASPADILDQPVSHSSSSSGAIMDAKSVHVERLDGIPLGSRRIVLRVSLVSRSMEDQAQSNFQETKPLTPGVSGSLSLDVQLRLTAESDLIEDKALLFDLSSDGIRVGWVMFPLTTGCCGRHRLRFNAPVGSSNRPALDNLLNSKVTIVPTVYCVTFRVSPEELIAPASNEELAKSGDCAEPDKPPATSWRDAWLANHPSSSIIDAATVVELKARILRDLSS